MRLREGVRQERDRSQQDICVKIWHVVKSRHMYYSCIYSRNCIGYFPLWRCHSGLSKIIWSVLTMKYINYRQEVFYVSLTTQIASIPRDVVHPRIISGLLVEELFIHFLPNFQTNSSTISTEVNFISVRVVTVLWSCLCT